MTVRLLSLGVLLEGLSKPSRTEPRNRFVVAVRGDLASVDRAAAVVVDQGDGLHGLPLRSKVVLEEYRPVGSPLPSYTVVLVAISRPAAS